MRGLVKWAAIFYAICAVVGWLIAWFSDSTLSWGTPFWFAMGLGVATALVAVVITRILALISSRFRALEAELRPFIGPFSEADVVILALASGIGEEIFFRGAIQPHAGWILTSLAFGFLHGATDPRFINWVIFATAMGFVLGGLAILTGGLLAPIVAHVLFNYINLRYLTRGVASEEGIPPLSDSPLWK